jgi:hypothetical protein
MESDEILIAIITGIGASVLMDLWNLCLKLAFKIPSLNYSLLGRWICHMPSGLFSHENISAAPVKPFERPLGWMAHYSIGVVLALLFVVLGPDNWLSSPTFLPPLFYGIATVVFPFFILQPALGFGMAASKTPHPWQARLKSLMTHTVFGVGLYVCAMGAKSFVAN